MSIAERRLPCIYRGEKAGEVRVRLCRNKTALRPVYACGLFGFCTLRKLEAGLTACSRCQKRVEQPTTNPKG